MYRWRIPPAVIACHHGVRDRDVQPCGQPCGQVQRQRRQRVCGSSDWMRCGADRILFRNSHHWRDSRYNGYHADNKLQEVIIV